MQMPLKVHAVKIRYREQLLRKMVHGRFGTYKGRRCVFISYLPGAVWQHGLTLGRYYVDSKKGRGYTPKIEEYLKIKNEFDKLLLDWRSTYVFEPPMIRFPISLNYDPHRMDSRFFDNAVGNTNRLVNDNPVYSGDDTLRSKNEQIATDIFKDLDIPYKYEVGLDVPNPDGLVPDFLLSFYEIDRCVYAEICGMSDKYDYSQRTARKINFYSLNNYRPNREIIYCLMYDKSNFDKEYVTSQILGAYDTLIPDSALDWNNCLPPNINEISSTNTSK